MITHYTTSENREKLQTKPIFYYRNSIEEGFRLQQGEESQVEWLETESVGYYEHKKTLKPPKS